MDRMSEMPVTITPDTTDTEATATRRAARIELESDSGIRSNENAPFYPSVVLNVSEGGALIFTHTKQREGANIQIELGEPIFPISRLVRGHISHVGDAPEELLLLLRDKEKADKEKGGYLLGVEFTYIDNADQKTLKRFIRQRTRDEMQRRAKDPTSKKNRTARHRMIRLKKAQVPAWAFLLGFFTGAYELTTGLLHGDDETSVIVHTGAALLTFWVVGRIAVAVWYQLDAWRATEATIITHVDGPVSDVDQALADADTHLTVEEEAEASSAPTATGSAKADGSNETLAA